MYLLLLQRTLIKLAYGCCIKPLKTYMSKSAQKINFTHLLKLFLRKIFNQVCRQWQDYTVNFGMNINSPLNQILSYYLTG